MALMVLTTYQLSAQHQISGKISDDDGNPLTGATIYIIGSGTGAVSDANGLYSIKDLPTGQYFLEFTFIGFEKQQKQVNLNQDRQLDVQLLTATASLGEVIVSANKQLQNIQETPISMTAIQAKQVEQLQIKELNELNRVAANFSSYDDGGGSFQVFASRGIYSIDIVPAIGVYVDDVPFFSTFGFPTLFSDIERIEVLKGPQGTLYGRNALGGVVNIITRKPTNVTNGFVQLGYGNLNQQDASFGVSVPLIKEKLYTRIHGAYTKRDGYIDNIAIDTDNLLARESFSGGLKMDYYPTDRLALTLSTNMENRDVQAYAFVGGFGVPGTVIDSLIDNHPYEVNFDRQGEYKTLTSNSAFKLKYDLPTFSITSITSLQYYDNERNNDDFDFTPFDIFYVGESNRISTTWNQEIRLSSNGSSKLNWIGGVYGYSVDLDDDGPIVNTEFAGNTAGGFTQRTLSNTNQLGIAFFGQATYPLTKKLSLLGGLRYLIEDCKLEVNRTHIQYGLVFEDPFNMVFDKNGTLQPSPLTTANFKETATFQAVSPKIGLTLQAKEDIFLFTHATRGYRPGGLNQFVARAEDAPFDPEFSWNYELGVKSTWLDNKLKLNLTAFLIDWEDQQLFTIIDLTNLVFGTDNLGKSRSTGVELESEWLPAKGLSVTANVGYLYTEIEEYTIRGQTGELIDNSGNKQAYSPEWNGNLAVNYERSINSDLTFLVGADYIFQSEMFFDPDNNVKQDSYGIINSRIGIGYKKFELTAWSKNLTDVAYFSYGYGVGGGASFASYALPRTYGITTAYRF